MSIILGNRVLILRSLALVFDICRDRYSCILESMYVFNLNRIQLTWSAFVSRCLLGFPYLTELFKFVVFLLSAPSVLYHHLALGTGWWCGFPEKWALFWEDSGQLPVCHITQPIPW